MKIIIIISISLGILFQPTITQQFVDPALIATLTGHTDDVNCVAVIPSQQENIVSGSADKTIKVWESKFLHQNPLTLRKHTDSVNTLVVKPSSESFLSSSSDQTIKIWDSQNAWQESTSFRFSGNVRAILFFYLQVEILSQAHMT
jgi:WD40 repeat protein